MNTVLIVKKGALGDVVRTSYFARALKSKDSVPICIHWLTAPSAIDLLRYNPYVDYLTADSRSVVENKYDCIFSLDDEVEVLKEVALLQGHRVVGAYLNASGRATYSECSSEWFDMGLLSKHGKTKADALKLSNKRTHSQIFQRFFDVESVIPEFFGGPEAAKATARVAAPRKRLIGINPYAGGRWKSKELGEPELLSLVRTLIGVQPDSGEIQVLLLGAGQDYERNSRLQMSLGAREVCAINTDASVLELAGTVGALDLLFTSDSLALHLAAAQSVPYVAFFAPTSAAEIDTFGLGEKVLSTSADYCSYRSNADNTSITAERLIKGAVRLASVVKSRRSRRLLQALA